ncbi:bifunctional adenosylcobinamide kinase/adenosylcobinamide-phosphate guanylyltransferase [Actinomadura hibisca]|uniref:bifunctional adenosylcobinamide kinase/adenosylcobinamide-phosphate guanylyltransferase n=1 Tax=Actinomadura hibisca TaxID=68565 RepID=UPI000831460F|nr:bifunctional adenosylcobinamide kinase/adenosylcobinamide-phosphate guanylyltransferase [Actinomadura hibisca]
MDFTLLGSAAAGGWPAEGCRCASCNRLRTVGHQVEPFSALLDGRPLDECESRPVPGGRVVIGRSGTRVLVAGGPGARPEPEPGVVYDVLLLDLIAAPDHLGALRRAGAVRTGGTVAPVHVDHRVPSAEELDRRLAFWLRPPGGPHRTLLLGGSRSGKSAEAELRLMGEPEVTYVATGQDRPGDAEWAARIDAHRRRRPAWWRTAETTDLPPLLASATGALLIDGIGTWLAAVMDETGAWDDPSAVEPRLEELVAAWRGTRARVVAVSDEVGLSLVPTTRSGRAFGDALGRLNQWLAAESEDAALVVAGRVVDLPC